MKMAIWAVFVVLAVLWSGFVALVLGLTGWLAQALVSGGATDLADVARTVAQWPVPAWMAFWVDPALIKALQGAALWSLDLLHGVAPHLGVVIGWLAPLVWLGWGAGLAVLLALTLAAHWYAGRRSRSRMPLAAGTR